MVDEGLKTLFVGFDCFSLSSGLVVCIWFGLQLVNAISWELGWEEGVRTRYGGA